LSSAASLEKILSFLGEILVLPSKTSPEKDSGVSVFRLAPAIEEYVGGFAYET
jgi:hypothetical protein